MRQSNFSFENFELYVKQILHQMSKKCKKCFIWTAKQAYIKLLMVEAASKYSSPNVEKKMYTSMQELLIGVKKELSLSETK